MIPLLCVHLAFSVAASAPAVPSTDGAVTRAAADSIPSLSSDDRIRMAEAFRLSRALGDRLWKGWTSAPFAMVLVTADWEYLVRHPRPSADFVRIGYDSLLQSALHARRRVFPTNLQATFPAVTGVPTIVVGQPSSTGQSSTRWVLTVLHEHFHQLQTSQADYYARVDALRLARGDSTGMWMLNYAFPYDSLTVQARFAAFAEGLASAQGRGSARRVADARAQLSAVLSTDDDRYLAFQMWQEGVARYTELRVARFAARTPSATSKAFRALPDYVDYARAARDIEREIRIGVERAQLAQSKRVAFYAAGAAFALLLDEASPTWRSRYFTTTLALEPELRR
jgi:hypothetical protein